MKKNTSTKKVAPAKKAPRTRNTAKAVRANDCKQCFNPWSLSIYVYWFIILFFIAATFYILGRSHNTLNTPKPGNVEITEEVLLQASDYYENGKTKLMAGNTGEAITDLTAAIDASGDVNAYILRGEAYMHSGDYRAAFADFDAAIAADPVNAVAYYERAMLNTRLEDYSSALRDINNALAAQTSRPTEMLQLRDLYAKRGQLNLWLKNWEGAIADYTNSLSRPEGTVSPTVYAERAEAYTATGMYAEAVDDYTSAVRIISEQIQGATSADERESLSNRAMSYFEKSAALNLSLGNIADAHSDLDSAYTIAVALNDSDTMDRLQGLMMELPLE